MWPITGSRISTEREDETVDNNTPGTTIVFRNTAPWLLTDLLSSSFAIPPSMDTQISNKEEIAVAKMSKRLSISQREGNHDSSQSLFFHSVLFVILMIFEKKAMG